MFRAMKKAYGGGFRAGRASPSLIRAGGKRGVLPLQEPLNPYCGVFCKRYRPIMAMLWELGYYDGTMKRYDKQKRKQS